MGKILNLIEGNMNGDAWEDLCVRCYRMKYQEQHYVAIPAVHKGDAGIEGYTKSGIVHQCYCPERSYSDNELYDHQRDKLSADVKKLMENGSRIKSLGIPPIHEWHFNIPEYKDSRILMHATAKQAEVLSERSKKPSIYSHIADDFQIIIKIAEDLAPEISNIIRTTITNNRINLAVQHTSSPDWTKCDSAKVENIRRKIKAVMHIDDTADPALNRVIGLYVDYYISGMENMSNLRIGFPEIYEDLYRLEQSFKNEVSIRTLMNTDHLMNQSVFSTILSDFGEKLEKDFSTIFNQASIAEVKQDLIASWLADCSMEFRSM